MHSFFIFSPYLAFLLSAVVYFSISPEYVSSETRMHILIWGVTCIALFILGAALGIIRLVKLRSEMTATFFVKLAIALNILGIVFMSFLTILFWYLSFTSWH